MAARAEPGRVGLRLCRAAVLSLLALIQLQAETSEAQAPGFETPFCDRFVRYGGLKCAEYEVTTSDGYVLRFQRIANATAQAALFAARPPLRGAPAPLSASATLPGAAPPGPWAPLPVLLDHALLLGADSWFGLVRGSDPTFFKRLPVVLASRGLDVFLVSHRCTEWSQKHLRYGTGDWQYWDWDWGALAKNDLPAVIGRVLAISGAPKVHVVGWHQGGMLPLALSALAPEYAAKVLASITSIGPIVYLANVTSPVLQQWAFSPTPDAFLYSSHLLAGAYNITNTEVIMQVLNSTLGLNFLAYFTGNLSSTPEDVFSRITGPPCCRDPSAPPLAPTPAWIATSYRLLIHYQQQIRTGQWQQWDFLSPEGNVQNYGSPTPPLVYASKIPASIPIFIVSGGNDWFADPPNIRRLVSNIGRPMHRLHLPQYSNVDLVWSIDGWREVFAPVADFVSGGYLQAPK